MRDETLPRFIRTNRKFPDGGVIYVCEACGGEVRLNEAARHLWKHRKPSERDEEMEQALKEASE